MKHKNLELVRGGPAEVVTVACCPNQNDPNKVSVLGFNLTSHFNNIVSLWCILNALDCNVLNNMAQLFLFCAQLETMSVKYQDKAHTTSFKYFYTEPYPSRALSIPP